ncbi:BEACH domain-containing protein LvsA-like protein [Tanacetum coccineum]
MEKGFLNSVSRDNGEGVTKKNLLSFYLASKITNIDRKMIGKDGKPLRAVKCVVLQDPINDAKNNMVNDATVNGNGLERSVKDVNADGFAGSRSDVHHENEVAILQRPQTARARMNADDDAKAENFITKFREQLKLQRMDSLDRYNDMLRRP